MVEALVELLRRVDGDFVPPLSSQRDLDEYATKLAGRAMIVSIAERDALQAFAAVYCNEPSRETAYLSFIAVDPACRGQGIASGLLQLCLQRVRALGFQRLQLEVHKNNAPALAMYDRLGFARVGETERSFILASAVARS